MKKIKINWDLLVLTVCLLIFNHHILHPNFVFVGDAFFGFNFYYFIYNDLFFNGQLAQWVPYGTYGLPAGMYQLTGYGPMVYLTMFVGYIFQVKNVLLLFKLALLGEQLIFLLGMYWLCRLLFQRRSTVFWVCLCAAGSSVCYTQLFFNFHIYFLFPLVAYLWLLFFFKKIPGAFWLGCLMSLFWLLSCPMYFAGLIFFVLFLFSTVFFPRDKQTWKSIWLAIIPQRVFFVVFFMFLGIYGYIIKNSLTFMTLISPFRNVSGSVNLKTFLTYGGNPTVPMLIKGFFFGNPAYLQIASSTDNTVYISLAALVFFIWAVLRVRRRAFFAFFIPTLALVALSFGGLFARLVFYLMPLMSYYRHIGLVLSLVKILMLVCAGFGFEDFLSTPFKKKIWYLVLILALIVLIIDSGPQSHAEALKVWYFKLALKDIWNRELFSHEWFRFGIYFIFSLGGGFLCLLIFMAGRLRKKVPAAIMGGCVVAFFMAACFLDMLSFQQAAFKTIPVLSVQHDKSLKSTLVNKMQFQEERFFLSVFNPPKNHLSERQLAALKLFNFSGSGVYSAMSYNFLQFDPLSASFKDDLIGEGVGRLRQLQNQDQSAASTLSSQLDRAISAIGPDFNTALIMKGVSNLRKINRQDKAAIILFGGYFPKLRLVPNAYFTNDSTEALKAVETLPDIVNTVVLTRRKEAMSFQEGQATAAPHNLGKVEVTDFRANGLRAQISVENPRGAWLVYSDAYHPGWKATVNGKRVPVFEAYGAFKAVYLDPGVKTVKFFFFNGLASVGSYIIALVGLCAGCVFVLFFLAELINKGTNIRSLLSGENSTS